MLGGLDPIIIFELYKTEDSTQADSTGKIPVGTKRTLSFARQAVIPIYLSENLTGLFISKEDKSVDIGTDTETFIDGSAEDVLQKGIGAGVNITIHCKKDSIATMIFSSVVDLLFEKVTSKSYSITYLHGATTIFRGVMHKFSSSQSADNDLLEITIELSKGQKQPTATQQVPTVAGSSGPIPVGAS